MGGVGGSPASQVALCLLFVYFAFLAGECGILVQRRVDACVKGSVWFKHKMVYVSILVFTRALGWFEFDSLAPEAMTPAMAGAEMCAWAASSFGVYLLFLLLNKTEQSFFLVAVRGLLATVLLSTFLGLIASPDAYAAAATGPFVSSTGATTVAGGPLVCAHYTGENAAWVVWIHNTISVLFVALFGVVLAGAVVHYKRQRRQHPSPHWDGWVYIFGADKQTNLGMQRGATPMQHQPSRFFADG